MSKFLDLTGVSNLWGKVKSRIITDINSNVTNKIGVANGIASLGSNAKLPVSQLPALKTINNNSIVGEGNISIDLSLYKIVNSLPTTNIDVNKIYLVLSEAESSSNGNVYTEYIYVNNKWEEIGKYKAKVDLTNYVTFDDVVTEYKNGVFANTDKVKFDKLFNRVNPGLAIKTLPGTFNSERGTYNPYTHSYFIPAYVIGHTNPNTEGYLIIPVVDEKDSAEVGLILQSDKIALDSLVEDRKDSYSVRLKLDSIQQKNIIEATISESLGRFANQQYINGGRYKAIAINTYIEVDDAIIEIMPIVSPVIISVGYQDNIVMLSYDINFTYYQTSTDGNQTVSDARATIKIIFDSDGNVVDKGFMNMIGIPTLSDAQYNILKDLEENSYSLIADEVLGYGTDHLTIPVVVPGSNDIQNILINAATSTKAGLFSAEMYNKLNSLNSGGSKFIIDYDNAEQIKTKLESLTISEDLFNNEFANCFLSSLDSDNRFTILPASCLYTNLSLSAAANIVFTAHTDTQIITLKIDASVNNNRFTVNSINLETRDIVYTNEQTTNLLKQ